ncbi:hypothetical protein [Jiangella gansuensis]|uniref:hypothetical protein n=1 Tax=Jiangella gansuensis TaxID=281473 RepID=UPI00047ADCE5|nr:hypothetical protein [Jiangella gansuensis]
MTDGTTTPAGDPRRHWQEAAGRRSDHHREPAPDLSDFAMFAARLDPRGSRWLTPALLLGTAVFCAWYSTVSSTRLLFDEDVMCPAQRAVPGTGIPHQNHRRGTGENAGQYPQDRAADVG